MLPLYPIPLPSSDDFFWFQLGFIIINIYDIVVTHLTRVGWKKYFLLGINGAFMLNLGKSSFTEESDYTNLIMLQTFVLLYVAHIIQLVQRIRTVFISWPPNDWDDDLNDEDYIDETIHEEETYEYDIFDKEIISELEQEIKDLQEDNYSDDEQKIIDQDYFGKPEEQSNEQKVILSSN